MATGGKRQRRALTVTSFWLDLWSYLLRFVIGSGAGVPCWDLAGNSLQSGDGRWVIVNLVTLQGQCRLGRHRLRCPLMREDRSQVSWHPWCQVLTRPPTMWRFGLARLNFFNLHGLKTRCWNLQRGSCSIAKERHIRSYSFIARKCWPPIASGIQASGAVGRRDLGTGSLGKNAMTLWRRLCSDASSDMMKPVTVSSVAVMLSGQNSWVVEWLSRRSNRMCC